MKVLGIDTSTPAGSIALIDDEEIIFEYNYQGKLEHSAWLMPTIDKLLKDADISCQDIDGIAISFGPGSFTGLRIGISTVKGLAQGLRIPVIGVSTLDSLACNLPYTEKIICPVLDAKKKEVYTALYRGQTLNVECNAFYIQGLTPLERLTDYLVISPQRLIEIISKPTIFLGSGLKSYLKQIMQSLKDKEVYFAHSSLWLPRASNLALLGLKNLKRGKQEDIYSFTPLYLRKAPV
ncbi:MAG: tRNA (adenosine(37)-N6)-threonylcarbamoyltransferase complex dimerization subunit type 1 TsaB [bacterium]